MDLIYSRRKVRLPKINGFYSNNKKYKKVIRVLFIILIAGLTFALILKSIGPIFEGLCIEKANNIGTIIMNEETNNVLNNMDYSKMVSVIKNEKDNTNIIKTDVVLVNQIASDIALKIEERFKKISEEKIEMPLGSLTGSKYLAGIGPNSKINIIPTGNIITQIKTEFKSQGINQTVYRVYLELIANVSILTSYKTIDQHIINQVLLVETVVVGSVPETYYNIDGINGENALDIMN